MQTIIARSLKALKKNLRSVNKGKKIGLVPTMGCLHDGHLELIKKSKKLNYVTVVTIFINPIQFSNKNDLVNYPSQEKKDLKLLKSLNVDIVFIPEKNQIYPSGYSTYINEIEFSNILCGKQRKNHFSGVLTIVLKLFLLIKPSTAFFGEKDFQQLFLIKKMVKDFNLDIKIASIPTVRDNYGLALSSRNQLLNLPNLKIARSLYKNLKKSKAKTYKYTKDLVKYLRREFKKNGLKNIEYLEVRESVNLKSVKVLHSKKQHRVFIAVKLGNVRLIDNCKLN